VSVATACTLRDSKTRRSPTRFVHVFVHETRWDGLRRGRCRRSLRTLRVSHADREQVIDTLKAAFVQGMLASGRERRAVQRIRLLMRLKRSARELHCARQQAAGVNWSVACSRPYSAPLSAAITTWCRGTWCPDSIQAIRPATRRCAQAVSEVWTLLISRLL
jgi:hypothetical protein